MCQVHHNTQRKIFFAKNSSSASFSHRIRFHTRKPPIAVKNSHGRVLFLLCQFVQPYGNVGVRELELVGKVGFRVVLLRRHAPPTTLHTSGVRRAKEP